MTILIVMLSSTKITNDQWWLADPCVEASFMMMNQVDSRSFDNDKDDDKKPKE